MGAVVPVTFAPIKCAQGVRNDVHSLVKLFRFRTGNSPKLLYNLLKTKNNEKKLELQQAYDLLLNRNDNSRKASFREQISARVL